MTEAARIVAWRLRRPSLAPVRIALLAAGAEAAVLVLAAWFVQFAVVPGFSAVPATGWAVLIAGWAVPLAAMGRAYGMGRLLRLRAGLPPVLGALAGAAAVAQVSGAPGFTIAAGCIPVVLLLRLGFAASVGWAVDQGLTERRAVLVGGGAGAAALIRGLASRAGNDIRICGIFDDRGGDRAPDVVLDVPKIGRFDELVGFCRAAEVDLIIVTLPPEAEARIATLLDRLRVLPVPVHLSAFSRDFGFRDTPEGLSALLPASFQPERRVAKRAFDLLLGGLLLVLLAPVMLVAAIAVRLDSPGPVFFRQDRHGFNDRPIRVWKFRSMYHDKADAAAVRVVVRGDARVTRVGRLLRKTSIDELPQLFNVLGGTLSLVGPRPHAVAARSSRQEAFDRIVDGYSARHRLPPGITGWAQVNGWRGEVDDPDSLRARFAHDLFYIENWSIWFDLAILLRTPVSLLDTRRAY
ncbi:sugar transferase [Meridianimarinicoccus roseus]|uniref:Sugar transferase n=1 Tax=Meridianimarinicoccus roseus TaxID=2072018 RepID=A0A2V2LDP6_9RHOB|nr:exopolysaccharide biosynthesis polyprenyl glycosylphosphotransferase [Meridianimarinicoccus roseus]PWR03658.1 sugar transferase [Meridianimarinicoccus roseus]